MLKGIMFVLIVFGMVGCSNTGRSVSPGGAGSGGAHVAQPVYRFQINFDVGSSLVKEKYMAQIREFASYLKSNSQLKVEIQGHTDSDGSNSENIVLSQQRAEAVKVKLGSFGVPADSITAKVYFESNNIAKNYTK
jgi:outer membrane protein OmpA-like peptidoglycan-associated protein